METEKVLILNLGKLKEENTKTLNDTSVLQKQQAELNDLISRLSEECRAAKVQLSEYDNYRIAAKNLEIKQKEDKISETKQKIQDNEEKQREDLNVAIMEYKRNIEAKIQRLEDVEKETKELEKNYKDWQILKERIDSANDKSIYISNIRKKG